MFLIFCPTALKTNEALTALQGELDRARAAMVLKEQNIAVDVVGEKNKDVNKSISIKIENNKTDQKEFVNKIQQATGTFANDRQNMLYSWHTLRHRPGVISCCLLYLVGELFFESFCFFLS